MGQSINRNQWNHQLKSKLKKVQTFVFNCIFIFLTNRILNPHALLLFDLLQLSTLPFLYLNPIFTHLVSLPLLQTYFQQIYPILYHFHTNSTIFDFPACLTVYTLFILILMLLASGLLSSRDQKSKGSPLITIISLAMALWPLMVFRISNQIAHVWNKNSIMNKYGSALSVETCVMFVINFIAGILILGGYRKFGKVLDFCIGLAIFSEMNQYAVMGLLGAKIIVTYFLVNQSPCKMLKLSIQASLYVSVILLIFIKPVLINYIVLAIIIGTSILYPLFDILIALPNKDLSTLKQNNQQDLYCTDEDYSFNQLIYFQKVNKHLSKCADLQCLCRGVFKVRGLKQLKKWIPAFEKSVARKNALNATDNKNKKLKVQQYFDIMINYIKFCTELTSPQQLDFQGYIALHKLHPQNIFQSYLIYHYSNLYSEILLKSSSNHLRMSIVNQTAQNNQYKDILQLENKIQHLIKDIKQFWESLVNFDGNNAFVDMIQDISNEINQVNHLYQQIQVNYDQKQQAEYYYSIFRLVSLHERPTLSSLDHHSATYLMVSSNETITNMTVNLTHLLQKPASQLLGHKYTTLMHPAYGNDHSEWQREFYNKYKVQEDSAFVKVVQVGADAVLGTIKVVQMRHVLMPDFISISSNFNPHTNDMKSDRQGGVNVVTLIRQNYSQNDDQQVQKKVTAFHMLVNRQNLEILAFDSSIFEYFDVKFSMENVNKLLRSNLKKLFPNINREAILNHNRRVLLAKQNLLFFEADQNQHQHLSKATKLTFHQSTQQTNYLSRTKKLQEKHLQISEVPSAKNKSLNLLLLNFELTIDCQQSAGKAKKTSHDVQMDMLKQKTLKNLMQLQKSNKSSFSSASPLGPSIASNDSQSIVKTQLILCLSFLSAFIMMFSIYALFQYFYTNLQQFIILYQNKATFYTDLVYTQAYYLGFKVGQNRIDRMEQYWNYNQYPDLFAIFRSIDQQAFKSQFDKYVYSFQNSSPMDALYQQVNNKQSQIMNINRIIVIVFWCCLILILVNLIASLVIFVKSQAKSIKILSSFLNLNRKQIKQNLLKIINLQKILQIQQFTQIINIQQQITSNIPINETTITLKQCVSLTKLDNFGSAEQRRKKKNQSRFKMKQQKKQQFQMALDFYFDGNNDMMINGMQCDSSMAMMKTPQNRFNLQQSRTNMINMNYRFKEGIKQNQENQSKGKFSMSILSGIYKNVSYLIPSVIGLVLRLAAAIFLLLFMPNLLSTILGCLQLKHNMLNEPLLIIQALQSQYFQDNKFQPSQLAQTQYKNQLKLSKLPTQFKQFIVFCNKLSSTDYNLCDFIDQTTSSQLYWQCKSQQGLFKSGKNTLIQYISQKLRQVQSKLLPKQYLLQYNQLSLSIKVNLYLDSTRNTLYSQALSKYYIKYKQLLTVLRSILIFMFILCGYLQYRQLRYTAERITRTQNLFKIVPSFMLMKDDRRSNANNNSGIAGGKLNMCKGNSISFTNQI